MVDFIYKRMVQEMSKESKEALIQKILSESEIETEDRCFANQCQAGMTFYNMNVLFEQINSLQECLANPNSSNEELKELANEVCVKAQSAKNSYNYIHEGISKMNNPERSSKKLEEFKKNHSFNK